ncbi:liver-expressed antimicrobial peptide 2-like [Macrotis lagotis]|uniref:liver-expressed antimicrobial peptide 2-like n=1 Tax=Macrotis lagotis TaxID=92651 RepID=UPI003D686C9E
MGHLKLLVLFMVCLLLLRQVGASPMPQQKSVQRRLRRMTPFWRNFSLRPIGASCHDNSECITGLCRKRRCSLNGTQE